MGYDTVMSDPSPMKLRNLQNGEVMDVWETVWDGNMLDLTLAEGQAGVAPGVLAEIESKTALYLGEVRQYSGSSVRVYVEHSLDRARLASMQDNWR